jgi:REP element-mobilizing transposase RayT
MEKALDAPESFSAVLATTTESALQHAQNQKFSLLILDTDLGGVSFGDLVADLRQTSPELCVSILPPGRENVALPLLGFTPDGYLPRPINAQEVLEQARELSNSPIAPIQELDEALVELFSEIPPPDPSIADSAWPKQAEADRQISATSTWTNDPDVVEKVLAYLQMKTGALGSFILLAGESSWFTENLSTEDRQDVESWAQETTLSNPPEDSAGANEMVGFVQLPSSSQDCQVFITPLEKDSLMGLVFGPDVPFRKVRSQVTQLVRTLIESRRITPRRNPASSPSDPPRSFSAVLVPRQASQKLTGKISASISEWIRQISASFGWQIEHLAVRPDHVLWIAAAPSQATPESQVTIVRQYTSMRMKQVFPDLMRGNPAGDFWASEPFIRATNQPPAPQELRLYIQGIRGQTRKSGL